VIAICGATLVFHTIAAPPIRRRRFGVDQHK
jgi:hypothetical protein